MAWLVKDSETKKPVWYLPAIPCPHCNNLYWKKYHFSDKRYFLIEELNECTKCKIVWTTDDVNRFLEGF